MDLVNEPAELAAAESHPTTPNSEIEPFAKDNAGAGDDNKPPKCSQIDSAEPAIEQPPPATLYALPDLCLIEIFEQLNMLDLYQAANICQRFRQVAVSAFRRQQRYVGDICWVPAHFVRFLRIFSPTKVRIRTSTNGKVFGAIAEYCHNLEALDIRKRLTQPHQLAAVRSLLPTLKTLSVKQMDIWNGEDADVDWPLETLYICGDCRALDMEWAPRLKLPKLKKLIVSVQNLDDPAFLDFLATNGHIEQLMMSHGCMSASGWHSIAERVPNLKSLTCYKLGFHADVGGNSVAPSVGVFKCLEEAAIWDCSSTKLPLNLLSTSAVKDVDVLIRRRKEIHGLKRLVGVTRLTLRLVQRVVIADVLANANAISGLRELHLHVGTCATVTLDCIKRLVDESKTITKLCVSWYKVMDLESVPMLPAITALVAARPKLSVEMTVERELFKIPEPIWRQHAGWLKAIDSPTCTQVPGYGGVLSSYSEYDDLSG